MKPQPANGRREKNNGNGASALSSGVKRCAIYVRKSTRENLDTDFNSLDAQREACEAYVKSQQHESWTALPDSYEDGGFSGGDMERPGLRKLLADIEARRIEIVLVYKVDRLSRSLLDFASMMSRFNEAGVAFVSVTQNFSTTDAIGKLTMNMLMSFAEFERALVSERTSDKMSAARRKGKWTGGIPVLGYDVAPGGGKLLVNESEAEQVRAIFNLYLEKQSLLDTARELNDRSWRTKSWLTKKGRAHEGSRFNKTKLSALLTNVIYLGQVKHRGQIYPGEHPAILDGDTFRRVQELLKKNKPHGGNEARNKYGALLRGILYCADCDAAMSHVFSARGGRRYRYYVCNRAQKEGWETCPTKSLPAAEIEKFVVERITEIGADEKLLKTTFGAARGQQQAASDALAVERERLEDELRCRNDDVNRLVAALGTEADPIITTKLAELQERIRITEMRRHEIERQRSDLEGELVNVDDLRRALGRFDQAWEPLTPKEQARMLRLLIERVAYDGAESKVRITFRPSGIKEASAENKNEG